MSSTIKTKTDIQKLKEAIAISEKTFLYVYKILKKELKKSRTENAKTKYINLTEVELKNKIEKYQTKLGAEKMAFDTIVASGKNSAIPHHVPVNKRIEVNAALKLDFGCVYKGLHSDITRTIFLRG